MLPWRLYILRGRLMDNKADTTNAQVDFPHDFLVGKGEEILVSDGMEAQKGSKAAADRLLKTVD